MDMRLSGPRHLPVRRLREASGLSGVSVGNRITDTGLYHVGSVPDDFSGKDADFSTMRVLNFQNPKITYYFYDIKDRIFHI